MSRRKRLLLFVAALVVVRLTYYLDTGSPTFSGAYPYPGSAACSWDIPLGTRIKFEDGWSAVCIDRGSGLGSDGWVDLFARSHAEGQFLLDTYGRHATVEVLR